MRPKTWTPALVEAVERIRDDNPMWGKGKIVVLLAREGIRTSCSTVGRILKSLMTRGAVVPVPVLRRRPGPGRLRLTLKERHARRLPKGLKPAETYDELLATAKALTDAPNRQYGLALRGFAGAGQNMYIYPSLFRSLGGQWFEGGVYGSQ